MKSIWEIERQAVGFTREEAEYIENADEVKVLCKADNYPLSWKDKETGEMKAYTLILSNCWKRKAE